MRANSRLQRKNSRRLLHAPGGPDLVLSGAGKPRRVVFRSRRMGTQGNSERREFRKLFERPHHCGVRIRHLEGGTMPDTLETSLVTGEVNACRGFQSRRSLQLFETAPQLVSKHHIPGLLRVCPLAIANKVPTIRLFGTNLAVSRQTFPLLSLALKIGHGDTEERRAVSSCRIESSRAKIPGMG